METFMSCKHVCVGVKKFVTPEGTLISRGIRRCINAETHWFVRVKG